jgi:hypothetical protein
VDRYNFGVPDGPFEARVRCLQRPFNGRPLGHDARRVELPVRHVVVTLDVVEVGRFRDAFDVEQPPCVLPRRRVVDDASPVRLEVADIHGVEPHEGGEQAPVGFGETIADQVLLLLEQGLDSIESLEDPANAESYASCDTAKPHL